MIRLIAVYDSTSCTRAAADMMTTRGEVRADGRLDTWRMRSLQSHDIGTASAVCERHPMTTPMERGQTAVGMTLVGALAILAVVAFIAMREPSSPAGSAVQTAPPASAAVAAVASTAAEAPAIAEIDVVEDPESAATNALVDEYGLKCTMASDVTFQPDPKALAAFDTTIADRKVESGWVVSGEVYKGTAADAAGALKATNAFADDASRSVWIVVPGIVPKAVQFVALETPAKNVVWIPLNTIRPCIDHDQPAVPERGRLTG